ncbi:MAG: LysM peptidoglycan-binding domain-containing protein [Anaerolineae bacterium]
MHIHRTLRYKLIGCAALLLALSGCFQSAGTNPDALSVAQSGPTFTPFPTDIPQEQIVVVTATTDPNELIQQFPTADPNLSGAVIPTADGSAPNDTGFLVQPEQQNPVLDPLEITATFIVGGATATQAAYVTQTAIALFGFPTATPTAQPLDTTTVPVVSGADCVHEVRVEDRNLYRISLVYGVTVDAIARASGITNPNVISVGQKLTIPGCGTTGAFPPATSIPAAGNLATPLPVGGPVTSGSTYVVQQGDTLFAISIQTGVPVVSIANANGISDIDRIFINQQLVIPAG